ncbi:MAG: sulfatase-like hydrolase/transferase [Pseudomonadota bacterium]
MERPNILFLLGESHAPDLLGAAGNPHIKTPNLDRLAARGALFDTAYCASPLCVPARAALATGRFPHESGYWDSSLAYDGRIDSWMKRLRGEGYQTVGIGKMHFRSDEDDYGFSEFVETMHIAEGRGDLVSALRHEGAEPNYPGLWDVWTSRYGAGDDNPYRNYDERIAHEAVNWLTRTAPRCAQPWALSVHFIAAHAPFVTPQRFFDLYDPREVPPPIRFSKDERPHHPAIDHLRQVVCHEDSLSLEETQKLRAAYYATVSYLDHLLGRVLDGLEEAGLAGNTLVLYTSDHGFSLGDHYIFGLFHLFEESLKVPLIMAGPGVPSGLRLGAPVSHTDLFSTILKAAGGPARCEDEGMIAENLWPLIEGSAARPRPIFAEYHGTATLSGGYVVREGAIKLIHFVGMAPQLFDLSCDPHEAKNLAHEPAHQTLLARMTSLLHAFVDPDAVDAQAKHDQRRLVERHGGKEAILQEMAGFSYSPPPGMSWRNMGG